MTFTIGYDNIIKSVYISILVIFAGIYPVRFIKTLASGLVGYSVWLSVFDAGDQASHQWEKSTLCILWPRVVEK